MQKPARPGAAATGTARNSGPPRGEERCPLKTLLKRALITTIIWFTGTTSRYVRINWHVLEHFYRERKPFLLAIWHNNVFTGMHFMHGHPYHIMISRSRDGDDITWVSERFGYTGLRGSPAAGASAVLREALRTLAKGGAVTVTPDGPRGPRYVVKPGLIALARKTGVPIVPICGSAARRWEAHNWDRMKLAKPFARHVVLVGDPIWLDPKEADESTQRLRVQALMRQMVRRAEALSGAAQRYADPMLEGDGPATYEESPEDEPARAEG